MTFFHGPTSWSNHPWSDFFEKINLQSLWVISRTQPVHLQLTDGCSSRTYIGRRELPPCPCYTLSIGEQIPLQFSYIPLNEHTFIYCSDSTSVLKLPLGIPYNLMGNSHLKPQRMWPVAWRIRKLKSKQRGNRAHFHHG